MEDAYYDYNGWNKKYWAYNEQYSKRLIEYKNKAIEYHKEKNLHGVMMQISFAEAQKIKTGYNKLSLHFFYNDTVRLVHSLAKEFPDADDYAFALCKKDFSLDVWKPLKNAVFPTATTACIILERRQEYEQAIAYCDFFDSVSILDAGKRKFSIRKERLLKKLAKAPKIESKVNFKATV